MITLSIKINGKLIGMRAATQMMGSLNADGEHAYVIEGDGLAKEYVSHARKDGAVKLVEKMLETMADDGTRFLKWSPRPTDSELEARPEVPEVPEHGNAHSLPCRKIN